MRRILRLLPVLAVLAAGLVAVRALAGPLGRLVDRDPGGFSDLVYGHHGPPVRVELSGPRLGARGGVCLVLVRDGSGSVAADIDPFGQVNREMAAVGAALARSGVPDMVGAVVFADRAISSPLGVPDAQRLEHVLLAAPPGGGTNLTAGFERAAMVARACPDAAEVHVVAVTDGDSGPDDITAALAALRGRAQLHLVALDKGGWSRIADAWLVDRTTTVHRVTRLQAGTVAEAIADVVSGVTGQTVDVSFDDA